MENIEYCPNCQRVCVDGRDINRTTALTELLVSAVKNLRSFSLKEETCLDCRASPYLDEKYWVKAK